MSDRDDDEHSQTSGDDDAELDATTGGEWPADKEDEVADKTLCPFCPLVSSSASSCLLHAKTAHSFDLESVKTNLKLDTYGVIRLINYLRTQQNEDPKPEAKDVLATLVPGAMWINDDEYLKPVVTDDPLLTDVMFDDSEDDTDDDTDVKSAKPTESKKTMPAAGSVTVAAAFPPAANERIRVLEEEVLALREQVAQLREALNRTLIDTDATAAPATPVAADASTSTATPAAPAAATVPAPSTSGSGVVVAERKETAAERRHRTDRRRRKAQIEHDDDYFDGYSGRRIHELMLRDHIRTLAYRDFMMANKHLFEGKVCLDVGCGTGILSMFAAKAGARMVIGIDKADMIDKAQEIVKTNKLDHIITLIKSRVEEAVLPVPKVDIIISEWMGYFLLFESMLPSVIYARDKWLNMENKTAGVFPNQAMMHIAAAERKGHNARHVGFWENVYGFDMSCLIDDRERWSGSTVEIIDPKQIFTNSNEIFRVDIMAAKGPELDFEYDFDLVAQRDESLDAFIVWFDTPFTLHCTTPVMLTTQASSGPTHWMQSVFHLYKSLTVRKGDHIRGNIRAHRSAPNQRDYDVQITYRVHPAEPSTEAPRSYVQQFEVTSGDVRVLIDDEYD